MADYADLTNLNAVLKNVYGEALINQFKDEVTTYNDIGKSKRKPGGLGYVFPIRLARAQGIGGRLESEALPDPLTGSKVQATITPKYVYGTLRITGPAIEAAKADMMSFVNSLTDEIDDIYKGIVADLNRQIHGDGWGALATLSAQATIASATTWDVTCNNAVGVTYLKEGMEVDFYESDTRDTHSTQARISSINPFTKVATMVAYGSNNGETIASAAEICRYNTREASHDTDTDTAREIMGLLGIFGDTDDLVTFQNISRTTYPAWAATVFDNSSTDRELTLDLLQQGVDAARFRSGMDIGTIRMGLGQRRKYMNLLIHDVQFAPEKLRGGFQVLTFAGGKGTIDIVIDPLTRPGKVFMEPNGALQKYELTPLGWGDLDGNKISRRSGYDEWEAFLRIYTNIGTEQCNSLVRIDDLSEPTLLA